MANTQSKAPPSVSIVEHGLRVMILNPATSAYCIHLEIFSYLFSAAQFVYSNAKVPSMLRRWFQKGTQRHSTRWESNTPKGSNNGASTVL